MWAFYNANGQRLTSAATSIAVLDIDGATDIGAAIVDADLFIIDDGAGGTNRKTAASRIKTYAASDVVDDTSPQLGGNLDMQARLLVGNGGSTGIAISAAGEVTMAAQPAVLAHNSAQDSNVTGNGTAYTLDLDTEIFDQNADFASDTFTAPITGRYLISANCKMYGNTTAATYANINLNCSNRTLNNQTHHNGDNNTSLSVLGSFIVDMDAADTCGIIVSFNGESSDVVDVSGAGVETQISVCLLA